MHQKVSYICYYLVISSVPAVIFYCLDTLLVCFQGYSRLGAALSFLKRYDEAEKVYRNGLKLEPNNQQLKQGLDDAIANNAGKAKAME